jgi:prepilin-type N-terminal cleavage/methylation domain-containing protein
VKVHCIPDYFYPLSAGSFIIMRNKEEGFTLLEIILALAIFSGSIIAVMRAFSIGLASSGDVEDMSLALNLAQKKMEEIVNIPFASVISSGPVPADTTAPFSKFNITVNVTGANPKEINTAVNWNVQGGTAGVMLTTLRTNY